MQIQFYEEQPVAVQLPEKVTVTIKETSTPSGSAGSGEEKYGRNGGEGDALDFEGLFDGWMMRVSSPTLRTLLNHEHSCVCAHMRGVCRYKPATLTNGLEVMVPHYCTSGEKVVFSSTKRTFLERQRG